MRDSIKISAAILFFALVFAGCETSQYYFNSTYDQAKKSYDNKDFISAQKYYKQFIDENPTNSMSEVAMYYLADSYRKAGNKDLAKQTYQALIKKYKDSFWVNTAKKDLETVK